MEYQLVLVIMGMVWLGSMIAAAEEGAKRGRRGAGIYCGIVLGPIGVVVAFFLPREEQPMARKITETNQRKKLIVAKTPDQLETWEAQERNRAVPPVPPHLRGRRVDEE